MRTGVNRIDRWLLYKISGPLSRGENKVYVHSCAYVCVGEKPHVRVNEGESKMYNVYITGEDIKQCDVCF